MKLISVNYGHNGSGKLYDYTTDKSYRAGDNVVVPVTHWISGKPYNTLATVRMTADINSPKAQNVLGHHESRRDAKSGRFKRRVDVKNVNLKLEIAQAQGLDFDNPRTVNITTSPGYNLMREQVAAGVPNVTPTNWSGRVDDTESRRPRSTTKYTNSGKLISRTADRGA